VKKVGDLFEELGFRKEGSEGVKRAFVENLVRAAAQIPLPQADRPRRSTERSQEVRRTEGPRATAVAEKAPVSQPQKEQQLSFDFDALEARNETTQLSTKRSAG